MPSGETVSLRTSDGVELVADFRPAVNGGLRVGNNAMARTGCVVAHGFTGSARNADVLRICRGLTVGDGHGANATMSAVTDVQFDRIGASARVDLTLAVSAAVATVAGVALAVTARTGSTALLVAIAVLQGVFALAWVFGTAMPGRWGAIVLAGVSAAAADVCVSVWPHGRLGALVAVFGLALPMIFVHQLARGVARRQIVASVSAITVLVFAEISVAALCQLRHEFFDPAHGGRVVAAAVAALAAAVVLGAVADLVAPVARIEPDVPRGLVGLIVSVLAGALVGYGFLRTEVGFAGARSVYVGLALGALAGLMSVAATFVLSAPPDRIRFVTRRGRALQPAIVALFPLFVLAPLAFLLCLAIRS